MSLLTRTINLGTTNTQEHADVVRDRHIRFSNSVSLIVCRYIIQCAALALVHHQPRLVPIYVTHFIETRVGIHTGPVVAGIVGERKFAYDIWGDTVNIASRMESSGEVGRVNISASTYALVKDAGGAAGTEPMRFTLLSRGKLHAKGKGDLEMYFASIEAAAPR